MRKFLMAAAVLAVAACGEKTDDTMTTDSTTAAAPAPAPATTDSATAPATTDSAHAMPADSAH